MPSTWQATPAPRATSAWVVFLLSIATTLVFWALLPSGLRENESRDYFDFYRPVAQRILAGEGVTVPGGAPATRYPPGYPFFLAISLGIANLLGAPASVVLRILTLAVTGVAAVLLYLSAARVWGSRAALLTALLWSTCPFALWLTKQPNSEVPFLALFFAAWALFWRAIFERSVSWQPYAAVGALLGLAMLIRPIALGTSLVLAAVLWRNGSAWKTRTRLTLVAVLLGASLAPVLPWESWAWAHTGKVIPLSTGGVPSALDGLTFAVDPKDFRQGVHVPADVQALMKDIQSREGRIASAGGVASLIIEEIKVRPLAFSKLLAIKAARSFYATNSERFEGAILALQIFYAAIILAGVVVACWRGGRGRDMTMGGLLMTGYFWAMTVSMLSVLRYMVPAIGLLFIPVASLFERRRRERDGAQSPD